MTHMSNNDYLLAISPHNLLFSLLYSYHDSQVEQLNDNTFEAAWVVFNHRSYMRDCFNRFNESLQKWAVNHIHIFGEPPEDTTNIISAASEPKYYGNYGRFD